MFIVFWGFFCEWQIVTNNYYVPSIQERNEMLCAEFNQTGAYKEKNWNGPQTEPWGTPHVDVELSRPMEIKTTDQIMYWHPKELKSNTDLHLLPKRSHWSINEVPSLCNAQNFKRISLQKHFFKNEMKLYQSLEIVVGVGWGVGNKM